MHDLLFFQLILLLNHFVIDIEEVAFKWCGNDSYLICFNFDKTKTYVEHLETEEVKKQTQFVDGIRVIWSPYVPNQNGLDVYFNVVDQDFVCQNTLKNCSNILNNLERRNSVIPEYSYNISVAFLTKVNFYFNS